MPVDVLRVSERARGIGDLQVLLPWLAAAARALRPAGIGLRAAAYLDELVRRLPRSAATYAQGAWFYEAAVAATILGRPAGALERLADPAPERAGVRRPARLLSGEPQRAAELLAGMGAFDEAGARGGGRGARPRAAARGGRRPGGAGRWRSIESSAQARGSLAPRRPRHRGLVPGWCPARARTTAPRAIFTSARGAAAPELDRVAAAGAPAEHAAVDHRTCVVAPAAQDARGDRGRARSRRSSRPADREGGRDSRSRSSRYGILRLPGM